MKKTRPIEFTTSLKNKVFREKCHEARKKIWREDPSVEFLMDGGKKLTHGWQFKRNIERRRGWIKEEKQVTRLGGARIKQEVKNEPIENNETRKKSRIK